MPNESSCSSERSAIQRRSCWSTYARSWPAARRSRLAELRSLSSILDAVASSVATEEGGRAPRAVVESGKPPEASTFSVRYGGRYYTVPQGPGSGLLSRSREALSARRCGNSGDRLTVVDYRQVGGPKDATFRARVIARPPSRKGPFTNSVVPLALPTRRGPPSSLGSRSR